MQNVSQTVVDPHDPRAARVLIGQVVSTDQSPTFGLIEFRLMAGAQTSPGKFVAVESMTESGEGSLVLARVDDVHEVNPHEDPLSSTLRDVIPFETEYADEGSSTVIYRIARAEPLEEAVLDADATITSVRAVESLARAGAAVFAAGADLTITALGLESDPDAGFHVGQAYGDATVPIVLNRSVIQRHIFIGGGIGSGKSYTRGVLAEELAAFGIPQINIDVNGEMTKATNELGGQNLVPGEDFTIPLSALSSADVVEAIPSLNPGTNMETLVRFAHELLTREVMLGKRDYFGVDDLVAQLEPAAFQLEMTTGSGDDRKPARTTVEPAKLRTASLKRLSYLGRPFDWRAALVPGAVINLDCSGMLLSDLRLITASVARDLQGLGRRKQLPFVVFSIDEFHLVAPQDDDLVTTQVLREIARIGRHYKIGLILTTQSPSDVDRAILKRLLTRFLHAIEPDQLQSLRGVFSDASDDLIRTLPKLPQGSCILTGAFETVRHATVVRVRERRTTHGGATPDIWFELAAAGWPSKRPLSLND